MRLAAARQVVAATGAVVALAAVAGLTIFGGPGESRREQRDLRRLADIQEIAAALACDAAAGAAPATPAALAGIAASCLASSRAAELVDPSTGDPYAIDYPAPHTARVCARFERADPPPWAPPSFDTASGCLAVPLEPAAG